MKKLNLDSMAEQAESAKNVKSTCETLDKQIEEMIRTHDNFTFRFKQLKGGSFTLADAQHSV